MKTDNYSSPWYRGIIYNLWRKLIYENGKLRISRTLKDGSTSLIQKWNESGQLELYQEYRNGVRHGVMKNWYDNGQLGFFEHYKNGEELSEGVINVWSLTMKIFSPGASLTFPNLSKRIASSYPFLFASCVDNIEIR